MPPKPKFSKEEIIDAAYEIVRSQGVEAMTAREVGKKLKSSARPIFTMFKDMSELKEEVTRRAENRLNDYLLKAEDYEPLYKQAIKEFISFANDEPNLFHLIFLSNNTDPVNFEFFNKDVKREYARYFDILKNHYGLSNDEASIIIRHSAIYIYGIGSMCSAKVCTFNDDQLNELLGQVFMAMMAYIKSGKINDEIIVPKKVGN